MRRYTIRQLEYALAAYDLGSIKKAAKALHVGEVAVSRGIQKLEHCNNVELFTGRSSRMLIPTQAMTDAAPKIRALLKAGDDVFNNEVTQ